MRFCRTRAIKDVLTATFPTDPAVETMRVQAFARFGELVRRTQSEGSLRGDFVPEDLVLLLMANAGGVRAMPPRMHGVALWR